MGHSRIGTLPATRPWKDVIALIANGANEAQVADAVMVAAGKTLARVRDDAGFRESMRLILQLALAGSRPNTAEELEAAGISIPKNASLVDVVLAVEETFDQRIDATGQRSDFAEVAQRSLVGAVTDLLTAHNPPSLFGSEGEDFASTFQKLKQPGNFGKFFQDFVGGLTNNLLNTYLSRTLGTHLGEGQRFNTTNQFRQFEQAMKTHCNEASKIVEKFAAEWFSKHRFEGGGEISREETEGFGWMAFKKMNLELGERARDHGN